jgi:serine/threonine-protein kinase
MAKNPDERYPSVTALTDAAQAAITRPIPQPETVVLPTQPAAAATQPAHLPGSIYSSPTQHRISTDPTPEASPSDNFVKRHRTHIVFAVAVLAILAIVTTIAVSIWGDTAPSANINAGPLNGTFTAEFSPETRISGEPATNPPPGEREIWGFQSTCGANGCIATASMIDGPRVFVVPANTVDMARALVLDDVGGRWAAVARVSGTCKKTRTDYWEIISLAPRADGSLAGERTYISPTHGCQGRQQVIFTRTGDMESGVSIADPAAEPARKSSPALALHGRYRETRTYKTGPVEAEYAVQTHCLRTGERCLSLFVGDKSLTNRYGYTDGRWVWADAPYDSTCANSDSPSRYETSLEYPLPQPPQNPIAQLTGRGHYKRTGDCAYDGDFESRLVRTGD